MAKMGVEKMWHFKFVLSTAYSTCFPQLFSPFPNEVFSFIFRTVCIYGFGPGGYRFKPCFVHQFDFEAREQ